MAGFNRRVASKPSISLYITDQLADRTESGIEAAVVAGNLVSMVETIGDLTKEYEVFSRSYYGRGIVDKLLGQADLGSSDFSVDWENSAGQNALLSSTSTTEKSFIFVIEEDPNDATNTNMTYLVRDGLLSKQDTILSGDTVMLMFTAMWTADTTSVDNSDA